MSAYNHFNLKKVINQKRRERTTTTYPDDIHIKSQSTINDEIKESLKLTQDRIEQLEEYAELYDQPMSIQDIEGRTYAAVGFDQWSASGLAVAWAEENTRDSIFQAFKRKETFATTGTRMAVRAHRPQHSAVGT